MRKIAETLRTFRSILNRQALTDDVFRNLLSLWGFEGIDLEEEQKLIEQKKSTLTRSQRDCVGEFIKLKKILDENNIKNSQESPEKC